MKHQPKDCSSYNANLAWLQYSMREPWWLQYLKSVFLKISIVTVWSVFQNQVTIMFSLTLFLDMGFNKELYACHNYGALLHFVLLYGPFKVVYVHIHLPLP